MSNPYPAITFEVCLETLKRFSWSLPYGTQPVGNQTESEAENFKFTRSTWLPTLNRGPNIAKKQGNQFTAFGLQAIYLRDTYTTGPEPVLKVV